MFVGMCVYATATGNRHTLSPNPNINCLDCYVAMPMTAPTEWLTFTYFVPTGLDLFRCTAASSAAAKRRCVVWGELFPAL